MSTPHQDRSEGPRNVTRRGALGRLFGLAGATVAAAALPVVAEAGALSPFGETAPACEPVTIVSLPDWLKGQPEWLVENVERYARSLAGLKKPLVAWSSGGTRERAIGQMAEYMVAGFNESDEPRPEPAPVPVTPREVGQDRIVTVRIPRLDRNERRRLRTWLSKRTTGATDPRVVYRLGLRGSRQAENDIDVLHVVAPASRSIFDPSPREHADRVVGELLGAVTLRRRIPTPVFRFLCAHQFPAESEARAYLFEWPDDGSITAMSVRRKPA